MNLSGRHRRVLCVGFFLLVARPATGEIINYAKEGRPEQAGLELLQEEPHDLILFKESAGGGWVKAQLFEDRELTPKKDGTLQFEVAGIFDKKFVAKWSDIEAIDLWEKRLERETVDRIKAGDFVGAYPYMSILIRDYPQRPGLRTLRSEYLFRDAGRRARAGELGPALAILEELHAYAPEFQSATVLRAISAITDQLMQKLVSERKLELGQQLLGRMKKQYAGKRIDSIVKWTDTFLKMAEGKRDEAKAALGKEDYFAARNLARESIALAPEVEGGDALVKKIDEVYPLINVGVLQSATVFDPTRLDNWAARRAGRLLYRVLFEIQGAGPEGGQYEFLFGDIEQSPDRMRFSMFLQPEKLAPPLDRIDGFTLADVMAGRARQSSPLYFSPWAAAIEAIGLDGPNRIDNLLRRPNVLPSALLQVTVDGSWFGGKPGSPTGDYRLGETDSVMTRFRLVGDPRTATQPRELVEIRSESAADAVGQLLKGQVDVLDQLFPADAVRLSRNNRFRVANYPLPSVHMLVPCSDHVYLAQRTFRRALIYGTNREDILHGELLEGMEVPGCQVLSGPFPAGVELNDPLGYAYDKNIRPRRYEPRLAKLLMVMTAKQFEAELSRTDKKAKAPKIEPIRLSYPADSLSRNACEAIKSQWELLGLVVELIELPAGRTFPEPGTADIAYVAAAVWEPIIDARRLLGPEGMARSTNQLIGLGLRRLEESKNWKDARDRLLDLHFTVHHELPVLPLWQLVDSYVYTRELAGVGSDIVSLYQNAEKWRLSR